MVKKDPLPKRKSSLLSPEAVEAKKLMERYKKATKDLGQLIDEFQEKLGLAPNQLKTILENQKNLNPQQWNLIEDEKEKLFSTIRSFEDSLTPKRKKMVEEILQPSEKKTGKAKARGLRQKWILVK